MTRGIFILLEGIDRSGKSTQTKLLFDYLSSQNVRAELLKFPNRNTDSGKIIDAYLSNNDYDDLTIHNLFSDNRKESKNHIIEVLNSGIHIICDRYIYSGIAYGAAKGIPLDICKSSDRGLPIPDITIYLDIAPNKLLARDGFGNERYENVDFLANVRQKYDMIKEPSWITIDADNTIANIHEMIKKIMMDFTITSPILHY